jgi:adenylate cyclase
LSQLFQELKRRNVFRVAIAYLAIAWVVLQVADIVFESVAAPGWLMQILLFFIAIGFIFALFFAWAFEMTPDGIKKEAEVDRSHSITGNTGKKLDRVIIGVLGAAVVFLLVDKFMLNGDSMTAIATEKSVAVLPFVAMSRGPDDGYFADGLTEEILNSLTLLPELLVTARTSSFYFRGKDIPVPEIAAALGVAHIVEGSVRRDGARLRVTAQLIRAADGFHLWSANYDRDSDDTFGVQTDIAEKIATALGVVMDEVRRAKMLETGVKNPEAFVAYQKGLELFDTAHGSATMLESLQEANVWFDLALQIEPGLAAANLWAADYFTHFLMETIGDADVSDDERTNAMENFIRYHESAIRHAPNEINRSVANYDLAVVTGQWRKLPALLDKLTVDPGCLNAGWSMETTVAYGKAEQQLAAALGEIECNPIGFSPWVEAIASNIYLGNLDKAIEMAEFKLKARPHIRVFQSLFFAYLAAGRFADAEAVIDRHIHRDNQSIPLKVTLSAARGDAERVEELFPALLDLGANATRPPIAQLAVAGDRDAANALAAQYDALPYGHLVLMTIPTICRCGAPFDLEATPNFARMLDEADFPWPPSSPINWPLKDW